MSNKYKNKENQTKFTEALFALIQMIQFEPESIEDAAASYKLEEQHWNNSVVPLMATYAASYLTNMELKFKNSQKEKSND